MKGKLIILVGISNSGKSTWAATMVQDNPDEFIRINRDNIRSLLYGYTDTTVAEYYKRKDINQLEKQITRFEDTLIYDALEHGKTVIVDATHLQRKYLERFKYWNVPTHLSFFDISLKEAIIRNAGRSRQVDSDIIIKQASQYKSLKASLTKEDIDFTPVILDRNENNVPCIVFDIDGTLAHKGDRSAYDWLKVGNDTLDDGMAHIVDALSNNIHGKIVIATGRDGVSLEETEKWLGKHGIEYDEIYTRPKGDMRPDWIVKREMAQEIVKEHNILGWFDDRLQVSRHLRMLGLNVYNVAHGNF